MFSILSLHSIQSLYLTVRLLQGKLLNAHVLEYRLLKSSTIHHFDFITPNLNFKLGNKTFHEGEAIYSIMNSMLLLCTTLS